ncbi:MAG: hypothetical protein NC925_01245, partial [Candidatus Omnitrophica bacterium]|nr:hypothetical protein [Candidatus Omnitrophota bacterium]
GRRKRWKWGPENWLWQYLYGGGELVDPEFWKIWYREFYKHRAPGVISFFSIFPIPRAIIISFSISKGFSGAETAAKIRSFKSVTTISGSRSSVYFSCVPIGMRWGQISAIARAVASYINFGTAIATGSDIGTAIYAYYEAHREYYSKK